MQCRKRIVVNVTVEKIDDINIVISGEVEISEIEANET